MFITIGGAVQIFPIQAMLLRGTEALGQAGSQLAWSLGWIRFVVSGGKEPKLSDLSFRPRL